MRSRNSAWVIDQALTAIDSQQFCDYHLYLVDCSSTDSTQAMAAPFATTLLTISAESYFPGEVLNNAIEGCNEDIIVFINSDAVLLTPTSLGRIVAAFDDPEVSAVLGRQLARPEAQAWVKRDYQLSFPDKGPPPCWIGLSLPLAAVRRSAWLQHRFYTEAWASEDTEWGQWAKRNGYKVKYVAEAMAMHSHNYTLSQLYGRRFVEGEADLFIYDRSKVSLFETIKRILEKCVKDFFCCFLGRAWRELFMIPAQAWVYHWAYYSGQRLAWQRQRGDVKDAKYGQREALKRYQK
ncbi:glycosyltransferase [Sinobacterium caligoides]|nr:glycosyltransferase family 2 protein [Sinobacterium caligoides]